MPFIENHYDVQWKCGNKNNKLACYIKDKDKLQVTMALWDKTYNMPLAAKINYKITAYMLENDNHQQNMLHVRMEVRQQDILQ
jgi:hypothetical protein